MMKKIIVFTVATFFLKHTYADGKEITIACVDCYSSASLAPQFAAQISPDTKITWILIQTHAYKPEHLHSLSFFPADSKTIIMDSRMPGLPSLTGSLSPEKVVEFLKSKNVSYVLQGMDKGAYATPLLNGPLGFADNSVSSREIRIKKDLMADASGDYSIPTLVLTDIEKTIVWLDGFTEKDVILKLNSGAGGDHLKFLSKSDPVRLRQILAANLPGAENNYVEIEKFIVQPKREGRKFYANTYTYEGRTTLTSVAEYHMIEWNRTILYCFDEFLDLNSEMAKRLRTAVETINPNFGIVHGPAHPEFILNNKTDKLELIEMNARIAGAGVPGIEREIYGISHLELHLMSILDPERLRKELARFPRNMKKKGVIFFVPSPGTGILNDQALARIRRHKSYFIPGPQYELKGGDSVVENEDQSSTAGTFYFVGEPSTVQQGIDLAVRLFDKGELVKFSISDTCGTLLKKGQLSTLIGAARANLR